MKDKKELLEQTIKEDLEKEAQEILKALETSDVDELSDEKQIELKKKIDKKIDVPNVLSSVSYGKKRQRLLRLKMGVLLDVRYNPFETSGD